MSEMYIQRTRGSTTSTNEGRLLARPSGTREHPRNQDGRGSTARDISKVATDHHDPDPPTKKVGRTHEIKIGSTTARHQQGRALHDPELQKKLVASALAPRAPGRTHEVKIGSTTARDISKVALSTASSDHDHDHHRKKKRRRKDGRASPPPPLGHPGARSHERG
jgi:hypothetical protein